MLMQCKECLSDVSSSANFCPKCGAQPEYFREKPTLSKTKSIPFQKKPKTKPKTKFQKDMGCLFSGLAFAGGLILLAILMDLIFSYFGIDLKK